MAELTYRDAVARGIAQEMARDSDVVFLGEDIAKAGGVFKATVGLLEQFGPMRVRDTPISEQAILGAAMGAAMTGLKPIAEIMFSDFIAVCFDYIANEFSKSRYMTNGQVKCPLVVRTGNGGSVRFGAQHSQSVENWCMMIPGLKVVAPSNPRDVVGLMAAAVRDPDPVIFFEHKGLYAAKGEVEDGEIVDTLGSAKIVRPGKDATVLALALMVPTRSGRGGETAGGARDQRRGDRRAVAGADRYQNHSGIGGAHAAGCLRWRKIRGCAGGARSWFRSWSTKPSIVWTGRRCALRLRIFRCLRRSAWKIWRFRASSGLPRRCASRWRLEDRACWLHATRARSAGSRHSLLKNAVHLGRASADGRWTPWTSRCTASSFLR